MEKLLKKPQPNQSNANPQGGEDEGLARETENSSAEESDDESTDNSDNKSGNEANDESAEQSYASEP